jgi:uncharacterized membrane protein YfhO
MAGEIARCLTSAIVGVGMSAILFIPSILYIMQNTRSKSDFSTEGLFNNLRYILFNLKGLILPAESMPDMSAIFPSKFYSTAAYLPMIGLVLVMAYIIKNRDWLSRLLIFCLIGAFWPLIGNAFFLYMDVQNRWWHAFVLIMALASCKVLEDLSSYKKPIKIGIVINALLIVFLFIMVCYIFKDPEGASTLYAPKRFIIYTAVSLIGISITNIVINAFNGNYKLFIGCISAFAVATTSLTLYVYRANGTNVASYKEIYDLATQIQLPDDQYRINNASNVVSMVSNSSGFSLFTSTDSVGITTFETLFDYKDAVNGLNKNTYPGLAELLGGRYYLTTEPTDNIIVATYSSNGITYFMEETEACPIGFKVDNYITENQLKDIPVENRAIALMQAAVVSNSDSSALEYIEQAQDLDLEISVSELVARAQANSVSNFYKDGKGFVCTSNFKEDSVVYFSVPYDSGWYATIDSKHADIIESGGMMLLKIPAGNHDIEFNYVTPGYKLGLLISLICFLIFITICIASKKRHPSSH